MLYFIVQTQGKEEMLLIQDRTLRVWNSQEPMKHWDLKEENSCLAHKMPTNNPWRDVSPLNGDKDLGTGILHIYWLSSWQFDKTRYKEFAFVANSSLRAATSSLADWLKPLVKHTQGVFHLVLSTSCHSNCMNMHLHCSVFVTSF